MNIKQFLPKTLREYMAIALVAGSVYTCSNNTKSADPELLRTGKYNQYNVIVYGNNQYRGISIEDPTMKAKDCPLGIRVSAKDRDKTKQQFNEIYFTLPTGHPLTKYANPDSLEKVYQHILKTETIQK